MWMNRDRGLVWRVSFPLSEAKFYQNLHVTSASAPCPCSATWTYINTHYPHDTGSTGLREAEVTQKHCRILESQWMMARFPLAQSVPCLNKSPNSLVA